MRRCSLCKGIEFHERKIGLRLFPQSIFNVLVGHHIKPEPHLSHCFFLLELSVFSQRPLFAKLITYCQPIDRSSSGKSVAARLALKVCIDISRFRHFRTERRSCVIQRFQQAATPHEFVGFLLLRLAHSVFGVKTHLAACRTTRSETLPHEIQNCNNDDSNNPFHISIP